VPLRPGDETVPIRVGRQQRYDRGVDGQQELHGKSARTRFTSADRSTGAPAGITAWDRPVARSSSIVNLSGEAAGGSAARRRYSERLRRFALAAERIRATSAEAALKENFGIVLWNYQPRLGQAARKAVPVAI